MQNICLKLILENNVFLYIYPLPEIS